MIKKLFNLKKYMFTTISILLLIFFIVLSHALAENISSYEINSLDMILLIDSSTSMKNNDEFNIRIKATEYIVNYLIAYSELVQVNYRMGFVCFAGKNEESLPLHLLRKETITTIKENILSDKLYVWTNFIDPLLFSYRELKSKSFGFDNKKIVILLTDGKPSFENKELESSKYFQEEIKPIIGKFKHDSINLFVLCIGEVLQDKQNWLSILPEKSFYPINDINQLPNIFHNILSKYIGISIFKQNHIILESEEKIIKVKLEPFLDQVIFSFTKSSSDIVIQVISPENKKYSSDIVSNSNQYNWIQTCEVPTEGVWSISFGGKGIVNYWIDIQYPITEADVYVPYPYTTKPVIITGYLYRGGIKVNKADRLSLYSKVFLPDGSNNIIPLFHNSEGTYKGIFENTTKEGTYHLIIKAIVDNKKELSINSKKATFSIMQMPLPPIDVDNKLTNNVIRYL